MRQWDITAKKCMKMRNLLFVVALGLITTLNLSEMYENEKFTICCSFRINHYAQSFR